MLKGWFRMGTPCVAWSGARILRIPIGGGVSTGVGDIISGGMRRLQRE